MYDIHFDKKAEKYLKKQDKPTIRRIKTAITNIAEDPYNIKNIDTTLLKGYDHVYRLRIGGFRIIYKVFDNTLVVLVLNIGSRGDIYKK